MTQIGNWIFFDGIDKSDSEPETLTKQETCGSLAQELVQNQRSASKNLQSQDSLPSQI